MKEKIKNKTLKIGLVVAIILLFVDQISKIIAIATNVHTTVINNILNLNLIYNKGIAFGIGQGSNMITFIITNLIVLGVIVRFILLQKDQMDKLTMYSLFMILSRRNWKFYR